VIGHGICLLVFVTQAFGQRCPQPVPYQPRRGRCPLYAILGVVRSYMEDAYGVKMSPVDDLVQVLVSGNFGCEIAKTRFKPSDLGSVTLVMNTRMQNSRMSALIGNDEVSGEFLHFFGDLPNHKKAQFTFRIEWKKADLSRGTKDFVKKNMLYSVVLGSSKEHPYHAMQGLKVAGNSVVTCNSWGATDEPQIQVGSPKAIYPQLKSVFMIDIKDVQYKKGSDAKWQKLEKNKTFKDEL